MATQLQFRRDPADVIATRTGAIAEPWYATDLKTLFINDGETAGGIRMARYDEIEDGSWYEWYTSADKLFGYLGTDDTVTCAFSTNTITVTIPEDVAVAKMYFYQQQSHITSSSCTITYDVNGVMTGGTATVNVDNIGTLNVLLPTVQSFLIESDGLKADQTLLNYTFTKQNTVRIDNLAINDDRVFLLTF